MAKESIQERVREIAKDIAKDAKEKKDPELKLEHIPEQGPLRHQENAKTHDQKIIDELLAPIPQNQGYYLVLYRQVGADEWELKKRIDEWRHFTNLEWEITKIVREETKLDPARWGTKKYKIKWHRDGGMRGEPYPDYIFPIDAQEPPTINGQPIQPTVDPHMIISDQFNGFRNMLDGMRSFLPPPPNPADTQNQIAEAFKKGMEIKAGESNGSTTMMVALINMMMESQKNTTLMMLELFKSNKSSTPEMSEIDRFEKTSTILKNMGANKSVGDFLNELRSAGVEPFKQEDPLRYIKHYREIGELFNDRGEKDSLFERLVEKITPQILPVLMQPRQAPAAVVGNQANTTNVNGNGTKAMPENKPPTQQDQQMRETQLFLQAIVKEDMNYFPRLKAQFLSQPNGKYIVEALQKQVVNMDLITNEIMQRLKAAPDFKPKLHTYLLKFQAWLIVNNSQGEEKHIHDQDQEEEEPLQPGEVVAQCTLCGEEFIDQGTEFDPNEQYICGENGCQGILKILANPQPRHEA
jgi:hypothetical protein